MYSPPKIWVVYLLVSSSVFLFGQRPEVIPVRGLPAQFRLVASMAESTNHWVIGGAEGVAINGTGGWSVVRPPQGGEVQLVVPFHTGFIATTKSGGYLYENNRWRDLQIDDDLYAGAECDGEVVLSGRRGIYAVGGDGQTRALLKQNSRSNYFVHRLNNQLVVFAVDQGVFAWDKTSQTLVPANSLYPWGARREMTSIQRELNGDYFIATSAGFFVENATGEHPVLSEFSKNVVALGLIGAVRFGDTVVAASWKGGLSAVSFATAKPLWTIPTDLISGNIFSIRLQDEGLMVGTSNGLWWLPDPERYRVSLLPRGETFFAHSYDGGVFIGLNSGSVIDENGVDRGLGEAFSLAQLPDGTFVSGRWGRLKFKDEFLDIGGQEVDGLAVVDSNHLATLQPGVVSMVDLHSHIVSKLRVLRTPNSIATTEAGKLFVGTSDGVLGFSATGTPSENFGKGTVRVCAFRNGIVALDSQGILYDENGTITAKLPVTELIDAEEWAGELCLLARAPDGTSWVGLVKKAEWVPLDIPTPMAPADLAVKGDQLLVVGSGMIVSTSNPRVLGAPRSGAFLLDAKGNLFPESTARLNSREDTVDLAIGPGRLDPWRNPALTFRTGNGDWVPISTGARVAVPRLSWGATPITVRSEWAGISTQVELAVFRATSWWAGYPAIFVYVLATGFLGYGIVRWRTWRLERRAARLELVVEQRTAQLRQAQQAREDFFSMMSHEIRNPLNGVVGLCEIVENAPPEAVAPRERMLLKTLRGCADQLRSILDDILDFGRIDRGEIQLHEEVFELLDAVEGAARGVDAGLKRCILELPDEPLWLRGDCGKLRQVVTNLVSNALKYGVPPAARVLVQSEQSASDAALIRIRVLNTGNTIPAEELNQIFEGYVRGEDARRRRISGTGLGLAVSRRIALAMKGSLQATSVNGLTEFCLELKFPVTVAPVEIPREAMLAKNSRALGIEDEPYNRLVLGSILGQLGYEVDWAVDGAEALAHVRTGSYDLILTDFMLPDTTGTELAKKLIEMLPEPKPPIIAVTAYSTPEKMQQAKEAGIAGFVTKPVSKKKIEAAIRGAAGDLSVGRSMDVPSVECNFTQLLRLPQGAQMLAEYADDLPRIWARLVSSFEHDETPDERARTVHAFRSRLLAVHATTIADQVALLEDAAQRDHREDVRRLITVIEPLLRELEVAARAQALTHHA